MPRKAKEYLANAGLVRRLLAFIADILILDFFVLDPFRSLFRSSLPSGNFTEIYNFIMNNQAFMGQVYVSSVFMALVTIVYFAVMEWKFGQSLGKMIFRIYVVAEAGGRGRKPAEGITFWQSLLRNLYLVPLFPFYLLIVIDPVYMFFNTKNQRLSEVLSRSIVVEKYTMGT
jgi:uncharacterized RDD family membrane protein YckC